MSNLAAVSLFAGIGGIDRALEQAGIPTVAAVEIDPACRGVLARHWPDLTLFDDVTEVTGDQLRDAGFDPRRGLVAAGWPCQGNSVAGRRQGMDDPRSGLWLHVARLLAELRPRWFLGENVPGLLSVNGGRDIAVVRRDLAQLGYWWAERVLDAQHFGVPQRRRRVFIVGHSRDRAAPVQVLLEPESGGRDPAPRPTAGADLAPTLESGVNGTGGTRPPGTTVDTAESLIPALAYPLVGSQGNDKQDESRMTYVPVAATLTAGVANGEGVNPPGRRAEDDVNLVTIPTLTAGMGSDVGHPGDAGKDEIVLAVTHALTAKGADASEDGTGQGTPLIAFGHTQGIDPQGGAQLEWGEPGEPYNALRAADGGSSRQSLVAIHENQRGEITTSDTAGALKTGGGKPGQGYPAVMTSAVRRLTPIECERLQGLPDDWTAGQSDSARYRQLGNAVAVPCVAWIARRIAAWESAA